jgi:hypothetical protein
MIVDGYDENPYPYEIGDILFDKVDQDIVVLTGANYAYIHLFHLTGFFADGGTYDCRIESSLEEYEKIGHIEEPYLAQLFQGISILAASHYTPPVNPAATDVLGQVVHGVLAQWQSEYAAHLSLPVEKVKLSIETHITGLESRIGLEVARYLDVPRLKKIEKAAQQALTHLNWRDSKGAFTREEESLLAALLDILF